MTSRILSAAALLSAFWVGPRPTHVESEKEIAQKAQTILKTNCYRCHGQSESNEGGFNHVLNPPRLIATKKVSPFKPEESKLYKKIADKVMPPEKDAEGNPVKQRPSDEDIAVIKKWVEAGAPNFSP